MGILLVANVLKFNLFFKYRATLLTHSFHSKREAPADKSGRSLCGQESRMLWSQRGNELSPSGFQVKM